MAGEGFIAFVRFTFSRLLAHALAALNLTRVS